MKTSWLVIALLIGGLYFAVTQNKNELSIAEAELAKQIKNCTASTVVKDDCEIEKINQFILQRTKENKNQVIQLEDGNFYEIATNTNLVPNTNGLKINQVAVWNAWKKIREIQAQANQKSYSQKASNDYSYIAVGVIVIALIALSIFLIPMLWRFLLNRIAEVSSAIKGNKF